ncbi:MAG: hypothetical protein ACRCTM_18640 [Sphaerotilus sulfidivorans]|uniref:hypothetical protein n=1 Tax=Sphaerotilus sulfidivorans TaxID=639200 RepID=UPI003F2EE1D1
MKWIIWTIVGVLAAMWTGTLATVALVADWTGSALQQAAPSAPQLPSDLPGWLAGWVDPAGWAAIAQATQQALQVVQSMLPAVGTATGWLEPLAWIVWGLGMVALVTVAVGSHWLVSRRVRAVNAAG